MDKISIDIYPQPAKNKLYISFGLPEKDYAIGKSINITKIFYE